MTKDERRKLLFSRVIRPPSRFAVLRPNSLCDFCGSAFNVSSYGLLRAKNMHQLTDTSPEIEQFQIQRLRLMSPARKLALVGQMNQTVRTLALSGLRQRYPDDSSAQHRRRLADLILGAELAAKVYGPLLENADAG